LDRIVELSGAPKTIEVYRVLDCCHAIHHVMAAVKALGYDQATTQGLYRTYRKQVRDGQWQVVVDDMTARMASNPTLDTSACEELRREMSYLSRHGQAGHMRYPFFSLLNKPIGSGAIESSIRRVINLRLKSNGMFWLAENAERLLQIRCYYVSKRLDDRLATKHISLAGNGKLDSKWTPRDMRSAPDHSLNTSA